MGMFDFVTKPINKAIKKVKEAPKKILNEVGTGIKKTGKIIGDAPGAAIDVTFSKPLAALGGGVGDALGGLAPGLGQVSKNLLPAAQGLLSTYLNPTGYADRKAEFTETPKISYQAPGASFPSGFGNINPMFLLLGGFLIILLIYFIRKK